MKFTAYNFLIKIQSEEICQNYVLSVLRFRRKTVKSILSCVRLELKRGADGFGKTGQHYSIGSDSARRNRTGDCI
ncbi:MAG: hypothetical protein M3R11_13260, partial [Acidobacteriota bacterium]|nr:hypothetical protein [Acidobacteriota bacterium]